jgi:hypothetical protein
MKFFIRDLLWLILVICVALGCWRTAGQRAEERMSAAIRQHGYFDDQKWKAVMFPLRDKNGRQWAFTPMCRIWTEPAKDGTYCIDFIYDDGSQTHQYFQP